MQPQYPMWRSIIALILKPLSNPDHPVLQVKCGNLNVFWVKNPSSHCTGEDVCGIEKNTVNRKCFSCFSLF